jgi:hypothetical protein
MTETLELRIVDPYSPEAAALIASLSTELAMRYDFSDDGSGQFKPEDANVPRSGFVVGYIDGKAVACGAFRPLEGSACEIKRMFVRPEYRGIANFGVYVGSQRSVCFEKPLRNDLSG